MFAQRPTCIDHDVQFLNHLKASRHLHELLDDRWWDVQRSQLSLAHYSMNLHGHISPVKITLRVMGTNCGVAGLSGNPITSVADGAKTG